MVLGGRFVPLMERVNEGVTSLKMVSKGDVTNTNAAANKVPVTSPPYYIWDQEDVENDPGMSDLKREITYFIKIKEIEFSFL